MRFKKPSTSKVAIVLLIVLFIFLIKIVAIHTSWVEKLYSTSFYQQFSSFLRRIFGWIPFSLGDILYIVAGIWLGIKIIFFIKKIFNLKLYKNTFFKSCIKLLVIWSIIYIVFNIFWGLNYNRKGIDYQLGISSKQYDSADLKIIQGLLLQKLNESKRSLLSHHVTYPANKELFSRAVACYKQAEKLYPFLNYIPSSVKPSLFGWLGDYLGFTGYYNPFTGEAQVNTTVPKFILPYTSTHEIAHQLGYAKEDEANFVGYLTATASTDTLFHYSTYLDLFVYANSQLYFVDSNYAKQTMMELLPEIKTDIKEWRKFLRDYRSPIEPIITWAYGKYLKANQQPKGMTTYVEVIAELIAFYKKFGRI